MTKEDLRILFMGTPDFAVPSLSILLQNGYKVVAVVTVPDKPAGRGLQMQESAVKKFALTHQLPLLQPSNLKDASFLESLKGFQANLQIVVAFRMLPQVVWEMPSLGTFNLHGSLLPQYRGAAPINWAVMNGEKESGVTTFFLQQQIDTGKIIHAAKCSIEPDDTAGNLHDKLMHLGAELVLKTVKDIVNNSYTLIEQEQLFATAQELKPAPKIRKEDCKIDWNKSCQSIKNKVRGLCPFPAAFAEFTDGAVPHTVKLFEVKTEPVQHAFSCGDIQTDNKTFLKVAVQDGFVHLLQLQLAGKKRLTVAEFLRGFQFSDKHKFISTDV
jgi:methionyl-tRNA formyltransferase